MGFCAGFETGRSISATCACRWLLVETGGKEHREKLSTELLAREVTASDMNMREHKADQWL
jgi:hypothetical protein